MSEIPGSNSLVPKPYFDMLENASENEEGWESGPDDDEDLNTYKIIYDNVVIKVEMEVEDVPNDSGQNESYDKDTIENHISDGLTPSQPDEYYPPSQALSESAAAAAREWAIRLAQMGNSESDANLKGSCALRYSTPSPPCDSRSSASSPSSPDQKVDRLYDEPTPPSRGRGRPSRGRARGRPRGSGTKTRGGNRGSSHQTANVPVEGDSDWWRCVPIVEVYENDEDIPPGLRDVLCEHEKTHREKRVPLVKRDDEAEEYEYDADSFIAHDMFEGDRQALEFLWSPMATYRGQREQLVLEPGPKVNVSCAYDAFRYFWDDEILDHIVKETNRYAKGLKKSSERFAKDWYDTNVHEILILFAFWIMLGVIRMPSIKSCYSNNPLLKTGVFRTLLSESRYWYLSRAVHFVNNAKRTEDSSILFCLGPVPDHLNNKFKSAYTPGQNITIEKSLSFGKGSFQQCIKTEAARLGIKTFELCESVTGYLWSFIMHMGKDDTTVAARLPQSTDVVMQLIKPLLNKGYRVFMDSFFTSPLLARYLKRNKTDCVGTLRKDRTNVPALIQHAVIPEGTCAARHSGDVVVMVYQDRKPVYTISTCHGSNSIPFGKISHFKPAVINDCKRFMGCADKKDQMLEPYLMESKKNIKWYINIFKYLLNVSTFNSRILVDKLTTSEVKSQNFRVELVESIMKAHLAHVPYRKRKVSNKSGMFPELRFSRDCHFIIRSNSAAESPRTSEKGASRNRKTCKWCLERETKRRQTVYICETCNVPLCLEGCFKNYHTVA